MVSIITAQKNQPFLTGFPGADTQIRTGDLILTKDALYRLSYISRDNADNIAQIPGRVKQKFQKRAGKIAEAIAGEKGP